MVTVLHSLDISSLLIVQLYYRLGLSIEEIALIEERPQMVISSKLEVARQFIGQSLQKCGPNISAFQSQREKDLDQLITHVLQISSPNRGVASSEIKRLSDEVYHEFNEQQHHWLDFILLRECAWVIGILIIIGWVWFQGILQSETRPSRVVVNSTSNSHASHPSSNDVRAHNHKEWDLSCPEGDTLVSIARRANLDSGRFLSPESHFTRHAFNAWPAVIDH